MSLEPFRSAEPSRSIRALLILEVLGYGAALSSYVWLLRPEDGSARVFDALFAAFALLFPVAMNAMHGEGPRAAGLRFDNLGAAARRAAPATLAMAGAIVAAGLVAGTFHGHGSGALRRVALYPLWGVVQQYVVNAFVLRRLRQAGLPATGAVVATALLFGLAHTPNWPLAVGTLLAGLVWSSLYVREPNILVLGLGHAILAVLAYHAWPEDWPQRFAVGRRALYRMGG